MITVAIIEEDAQRQQELKIYLQAQEEITCAATGSDMVDLENIFRRAGGIQVLIIGVLSDGQDKLLPTQLRKIKELNPSTEVLILADSTDTTKVITWLRAGVVGYLPRHSSLPQIKEAILDIGQGGAHILPLMVRKMLDSFRSKENLDEVLTQREKEIVQCLVEGMSYKLVAFKLNVAFDTVRYHLRNIYKKLHVNNKSQVISKVLNREITF